MVNSHPIALFLMVNSHPIALNYGKLSPHRSFFMVNSHPIPPFYGELLPHPRWLSLAGLTLLLTASDMEPAFEASLIVLG